MRILLGTGPVRSQLIFGWVCLVPILAYYAFFAVYPIFSAFWVSLHRWSLTVPRRPFVGVDNYVWVLNDGTFWISLTNTLYYAVAFVTASILIGLALGTLIWGFKEPYKSILQTIVFFPVMTSMVVAAQVWELMYDPGYGILNHLLRAVGLSTHMWLRSPNEVMPSIIIMSVWKHVGYYAVLFIAGLTTIPQELYEVAWIDGASRWQTFWHIVLPLLAPTTVFCLVTGSIGAFQVFTQVYASTSAVGIGGPGKASYVLLLYLYDHGFKYFEMGRASAIAFVLFGLVLVVTLIQMRLMRERFQY